MDEFAVITGLSGAGRTLAADALEDLGWFVIDNLPPQLAPKVAELVQAPGSQVQRIALVVVTGAYQDEVLPMLAWLRSAGARVRIVFLDAATDTLVRRYESTRRRHPLSGGGSQEHLAAAIERERELLDPVRAEADVVVDTSELNVDELRPLTGLDERVREYVLRQPAAQEFLENLETMLVQLLPAYVAEGKAYLTIALGCTGGHHRSVTIAEEVARLLRKHGMPAGVLHRDIDK